METANYFKTSVMARRPYLQESWIKQAISNPVHVEIQANGRIRYWVYIDELEKYLRVITEADGTVHNAFPDRRFKPIEK